MEVECPPCSERAAPAGGPGARVESPGPPALAPEPARPLERPEDFSGSREGS